MTESYLDWDINFCWQLQPSWVVTNAQWIVLQFTQQQLVKQVSAVTRCRRLIPWWTSLSSSKGVFQRTSALKTVDVLSWTNPLVVPLDLAQSVAAAFRYATVREWQPQLHPWRPPVPLRHQQLRRQPLKLQQPPSPRQQLHLQRHCRRHFRRHFWRQCQPQFRLELVNKCYRNVL